VVTAADGSPPIAVDVIPGHRHESPLLKPLLDKSAARVGAIAQAAGDKGFDGGPQREACLGHQAVPVIPAKKNRAAPEPRDAVAYRERNRVERLIGEPKEFRRVATRYDKRKPMFLGWLHLILGFTRLRAQTNVNRA
jgi:transposase